MPGLIEDDIPGSRGLQEVVKIVEIEMYALYGLSKEAAIIDDSIP